MMRICLLSLLGLPGAGKTTFSRWLLSLQQCHFNILHICFDDFLLPDATATATTEFDFKAQRAAIVQFVEQLVLALKSNKKIPAFMENKIAVYYGNVEDFLIICDDNNYYRSMRYKLYQFCKQASLAYAQVYLECDLQLALTRNAARTDSVSPHILTQMSQRLEAPSLQSPTSWEAHTLILSAAECNYSTEVVFPFLLQAYEHILQPVAPNTPKVHIASALHELDVLLRRRIKQLLSEEAFTSAAAKQAQAKSLNNKRKVILQDLKDRGGGSGSLLVNESLSTIVNMLH